MFHRELFPRIEKTRELASNFGFLVYSNTSTTGCTFPQDHLPRVLLFMWDRCPWSAAISAMLSVPETEVKCLLPWTSCFVFLSGSNLWLIPIIPMTASPSRILQLWGTFIHWGKSTERGGSSHTNGETQKS